jgi:hypothetical protein
LAENRWDEATLQSRISSVEARTRHPGASPDAREVAAYREGLRGLDTRGAAVVLGMTPELRRLALGVFDRIETVDNNPAAIATYRDWVDPALRARERLLEGDWLELKQLVSPGVVAVLGDGVFGNLPDADAHRALLAAVRSVVGLNGRLVTRMAMIHQGFNPAAHRAERLLSQFRAGELDEAEFGFGMRLVGHYDTCYDPVTHLLDNTRLYAACDATFQRGEFTPHEQALLQRYRFEGRNCILPQDVWEALLREQGFSFQKRPCAGKAWYAYYTVYECRAA